MTLDDETSCGALNSKISSTVSGVILLASSLFLIFKQNWSSIKALRGVVRWSRGLVFPSYYNYLKLMIVLLLLEAVRIRFMPYDHRILYGFMLGISDGIFGSFREGLCVFMVQKSAGIQAWKRSGIFIVIWTFSQCALVFNFFFSALKGNNDQVQFLGLSIWYYFIHDLSHILFYTIIIIVMISQMILKRNERLTKWHLIYPFFNLSIGLSFLVSDVVRFRKIQGEYVTCIGTITQLIYYSCIALIMYFTLKIDSDYWRQADKPAKSKASGEESLPLMGAESHLAQLINDNTIIIDFWRLKIGKDIGGGGYSRVYEGTLDNEKTVAIKKVFCKDLTKKQIAEYSREIKFASLLRHPNIVELYGVSIVLPELALVMELASRGSLYSVLRQSFTSLSMARKIGIASDCATALEFLHSRDPPVLHLDLKSPNVLITEDWTAKLSDFGQSRSLHAPISGNQNVIGTVQWCAPEVIKNREYSEKADIYSLGMVMYEIISGKQPFDDSEKGAIPYLVTELKKRPKIPEDCPLLYSQLIESCWQEEFQYVNELKLTYQIRERPQAKDIIVALKELIY